LNENHPYLLNYSRIEKESGIDTKIKSLYDSKVIRKGHPFFPLSCRSGKWMGIEKSEGK